MSTVTFYRKDLLPFLEAKRCMRSDLAYQKHFHTFGIDPLSLTITIGSGRL
ncbi:hypothetical protein [Paenibacillus sp. FSL A5-0031]|uniref:hypothetical protein n=1 Tax=Paenibacillus sp. FSL A5-0031 TaxID=1920420 RepID=UPI0015C373E1|nr:hypothetical protein [Paenibacillus sp. FSL A5-0031]